jgi:predicted Zn-dependent protease
MPRRYSTASEGIRISGARNRRSRNGSKQYKPMNNVRRKLKALLLLSFAAILVAETTALAQDLPDFGSPADSVLTKTRERLLGRSIVLQLRNAGAVVDDPLLTEYIGLIGSRIASQANDGNFEFEFLVIDDDAINAFAMPGGVVGVNAGLLLATDNESELAGVLAHEVSHVTQRHIARSLAAQKRTSLVTMAASLAAILIGSATDSSSDATMGVATAAQAAGVQSQINFTRTHEMEADRIGMDVLVGAGFDPLGMANFFEKLSRFENRSANSIPEMLRTHPLSSGRITESRMRANQLAPVEHKDSIGYRLAKARLRVLSARRTDTALAYYRPLAESTDPADRYGYALTLMRVGLEDQAERILRELSESDPGVMAYWIGRAEALSIAGLDDQAIAVYQEANVLSPRNIPLVVSYAEALLNADRADEAHRILLDLLNNVDPTPKQIELLARTANAEGDLINAHHYMSEYYASIGNLRLAIAQLEAALATPGVSNVERARFNARLDEFREYLEEMER